MDEIIANSAFDLREDRVRAHSDPEINQRIDQETALRLRLYANADKILISHRLRELDQEWDMERLLETNASSLVVASVALGVIGSRKWFILPAIVGGFLLQHAIQGWCPPVPVFRRMGIRTRKEIERERYALKLLRGDFDAFHSGEKADVNQVLAMIDR